MSLLARAKAIAREMVGVLGTDMPARRWVVWGMETERHEAVRRERESSMGTTTFMVEDLSFTSFS